MDLEIHGAGQQTEVVWLGNLGDRWEEESLAGNIHGKFYLVPNGRISGYDKTERSQWAAITAYYEVL